MKNQFRCNACNLSILCYSVAIDSGEIPASAVKGGKPSLKF